jgi:KDO2-lipid IV(A) lauroyltransferase
MARDTANGEIRGETPLLQASRIPATTADQAKTALFPFWRYLSPLYWPVWIGLGFTRLCVLLPFGAQLALGRGLGRLLHFVLTGRRRIVDINLSLCFPEMDAAERKRLVRATFESSGIAVFEVALAWWGGDERLRKLHRMEGQEHLAAARALGKGVILLGGHYTTLEISGRLLAFNTDRIQPIYKPARNALYEAVMAGSRKRTFENLLANDDMRAILRALKSGATIWYAPDQDFGRDRSVFAPFFGVPATTLLATMRLARLSGAPVLPFYSERLPGTEGYLIRIGAPLANFPTGDDVADGTAVNAAIEEQVRRTPEQYLWLHKRFKSRPIGEPSVYKR